jgi:chemotaxis protein MotA
MEPATALGLVVAFGAIIGGLIIGGTDPRAFWDAGSMVIVLGGAVGSTIISYPMKTVVNMPKYITQVFTAYRSDPLSTIELFVQLADQARREGLLSLEEQIGQVSDAFIKKGIMLVVDGVDPQVVRSVLETDSDLSGRRHDDGITVMESLASFCPAFGMIGTLIGLIAALGNLSDASQLGPAVAVAFITTFYGAVFANLIFSPLAKKLKQKNKLELTTREIIVEGVLSIQAGENPRIVREKLESFLEPKQRGQEPKSAGE